MILGTTSWLICVDFMMMRLPELQVMTEVEKCHELLLMTNDEKQNKKMNHTLLVAFMCAKKILQKGSRMGRDRLEHVDREEAGLIN